MDTLENLRMQLEAKPENLAAIRAQSEVFARAGGASRTTIGDLKTVVTEACTNAIRYAYGPGEVGAIEVEIVRELDSFHVSVQDHGNGLMPNPDQEEPSLGMGLPIISALSERVQLCSERGQGTRLDAWVAND